MSNLVDPPIPSQNRGVIKFFAGLVFLVTLIYPPWMVQKSRIAYTPQGYAYTITATDWTHAGYHWFDNGAEHFGGNFNWMRFGVQTLLLIGLTKYLLSRHPDVVKAAEPKPWTSDAEAIIDLG